MERLGQHFLKDQKILRKITEALELKPGKEVLEIGPGHGELTEEVVSRFKALGINDYKLIAIEKDRDLAEYLKEKFAANENVEIIQGDALEVLPSLTSNPEHKNYLLTGNIPYYITGFLLRTIGSLNPKPGLAVLMVQKEVAERMTDNPPRMNRLAASIGFWAESKILFNVPRKSFTPPPQVDSSVVLFTPKPEKGDGNAYYTLVRALFKQPRKTIWNNLRDSNFENVDKALSEAGINPHDRPQNLTIQNIIDLAKTLKNSH
jgi:16S rRNA (adenine1518-N6/adenine1519-N6)-dimethyltransferase